MKHIKKQIIRRKTVPGKRKVFGHCFFVWERDTIYGYKEKIISQNKRDYKGTVI